MTSFTYTRPVRRAYLPADDGNELIVEAQQEYHHTHGQIMRAHELHQAERARAERVGGREGAALY